MSARILSSHQPFNVIESTILF